MELLVFNNTRIIAFLCHYLNMELEFCKSQPLILFQKNYGPLNRACECTVFWTVNRQCTCCEITKKTTLKYFILQLNFMLNFTSVKKEIYKSLSELNYSYNVQRNETNMYVSGRAVLGNDIQESVLNNYSLKFRKTLQTPEMEVFFTNLTITNSIFCKPGLANFRQHCTRYKNTIQRD